MPFCIGKKKSKRFSSKTFYAIIISNCKNKEGGISLFGKTSTPFGLDIGFKSIQMVQLKKKGKLMHLFGYNEVALPDGAFDQKGFMNPSIIADKIKEGMQTSKVNSIKSNHVVCSLPEAQIFVKMIQLPKMGDDELAKAIKFEVDKFVPFSMDEIFLDWERMKSPEGATKDRVLIVAAPKDLANNYIETCKLAGLEITALEMDPAAVARAMIKKGIEGIDEAIIIADIGANSTGISIYDNGSIQLTCSTRTAGDSITQRIADKMGANKTTAERYKREVIHGEKMIKPEILKSIEPVLKAISDEIKRSVTYYKRQAEGSHDPQKILLCGGNALFPGVDRYLEEHLGVKTTVGNPWANVTTYPLKPLPKFKATLYTTAIGLALREDEE